MKINYRKIYEQHCGVIPKDKDGRSYQIHHIDGNRANNNISNLKCVSIQEHYDIHYSQGDWGACYLIGRKMKIPVNILSELVRQQQYDRIAAGTHNWLGKNNPVHEKIANGTHNFLGGEISKKVNAKRVANGTHNFLGATNPSHERVRIGTHNFQDPEHQKRISAINREHQNKRVADGSHHLLGGKIQRQIVKEGRHNLQGSVTCRDKSGKVVQVPKKQYWNQTGDRESWEYVSINCAEGKKRKRTN